MWFTEPGGNRVGRITPTGSFTEFTAGITAGSSPNAIAPGPDGNLWFSEAVGNRIARIGSGVDVLVRAPAVYGAGRVGERALCDEGAWKASLDIGSYGIQWTRDGVDLAGATAASTRRSRPTSDTSSAAASRPGRPACSPSTRRRAARSPSARRRSARPGRRGRRRAGRRGECGGRRRGRRGGAAARQARQVAGAHIGARGAAATAGTAAALLHARLTTLKGKRFTVRYIAAQGHAARARRATAERADRRRAWRRSRRARPGAAASPRATRSRRARTRSCSRRSPPGAPAWSTPCRCSSERRDAGAASLHSVDSGTSGGGLRRRWLTGLIAATQ